MLILLVSTYWLFMLVSFGALSKILWTLNPQLALLTIGFFLLAKITKSIAEFNVTKLVANERDRLIKQGKLDMVKFKQDKKDIL